MRSHFNWPLPFLHQNDVVLNVVVYFWIQRPVLYLLLCSLPNNAVLSVITDYCLNGLRSLRFCPNIRCMKDGIIGKIHLGTAHDSDSVLFTKLYAEVAGHAKFENSPFSSESQCRYSPLCSPSSSSGQSTCISRKKSVYRNRFFVQQSVSRVSVTLAGPCIIIQFK